MSLGQIKEEDVIPPKSKVLIKAFHIRHRSVGDRGEIATGDMLALKIL